MNNEKINHEDKIIKIHNISWDQITVSYGDKKTGSDMENEIKRNPKAKKSKS